ncbi:hypothetical protein BM449_03600 [Synechococcus sp. SynAce01]|nr:hypothetical protein BM449_03600 [Synechococcus sp. SynAce01]
MRSPESEDFRELMVAGQLQKRRVTMGECEGRARSSDLESRQSGQFSPNYFGGIVHGFYLDLLEQLLDLIKPRP